MSIIVSYKSWDGNALNDGTNYKSYKDRPATGGGQSTNPVYTERTDNWPLLSATKLQPYKITVNIQIIKDARQGLAELSKWFSLTNTTPKMLIGTDDAGVDWYVYARPLQIIPVSAVLVQVILGTTDEAYWQAYTQTSTTWSVASTGSTKTIAVAGNQPAHPIFEITPTGARTGGYTYRQYRLLRNPNPRAMMGYPYDLTGGGWDAVQSAGHPYNGKMQADGDDIAVQDNGQIIYRWLSGAGTATLKIWANFDFDRALDTTLGANIAASGAVTEITIRKTVTNKLILQKMPERGTVVIGTEAYNYTGRLFGTTYQLTGCTRAVFDTSMGAHTAGDAVYFIHHVACILYGDSSATAPTVDDDYKPMIDLTSTNTSWVYTSFADTASHRTAGWTGAVLESNSAAGSDTASGGTGIYTGSHGVMADPATEMGAVIRAFQRGSRWQACRAKIAWSFYHPGGVTHVTSSGAKYTLSTSWPTYASLQYGNTDWTNEWTDAAPAAATWTAWTHAAADLGGTWPNLRFLFFGSISGTTSNEAMFEVQGATLTLASAGVPQVVACAEVANYYMGCRITNTTTGQFFDLAWPLALNDTLTVDTVTQTVTFKGADAYAALKCEPRTWWLDMPPGNNVLSYTDTGTGAVTVVVKHRNRSSV